MDFIRKASIKALASIPNLYELLAACDPGLEGLIGRDDVARVLEEQKQAGLTKPEIQMLVRYGDKDNKGYICYANFIEKLHKAAQMTEKDRVLKWFAQRVKA